MKKIGVLTSGGDSPGMNAAVRAIVRTGLDKGAEIFAIYEGYQGMVENNIRPMKWFSVGGILHQGGTVIGSSRSEAFRTREGRRQAAFNLIQRNIDSLVVVGGDGSLTGANLFRQEWPGLLAELRDEGRISAETVAQHDQLTIMGLPGSIDNDLVGTDMTIGTDTALRRITDAVDAITSTAASHQRSFVVEVMGRHCGYLALMSALSSGADWVFIPESPPDVENWEDIMCEAMRSGREIGRRDSIVIVAEGAIDRKGKAITSQYVKEVLETRLGEDTRVTILGHVQRGGSPSAFDRNLSTLLGADAIDAIFDDAYRGTAYLIGIKDNDITRVPLADCLAMTKQLATAVQSGDYETAMQLRGGSFVTAFNTVRTLVRAKPHSVKPGQRRLRLAVMNAGAPSPGMNTAVRAAIRLGLDKGHVMLGVQHGFQGLIDDEIEEMDWMSVNGWAWRGGAELGTNRYIPQDSDFYAMARNIEKHQIQGLLLIGGWSGYQAVLELYKLRNTFPAFNLPIICLPATIDNDLAGSELCVGADTALNNITEAVDKIKQSAVASRRVFVVEVMGRQCGYLALMSALATGAEQVYLHEEGITLKDLQSDVERLKQGFQLGQRLGLIIRTEDANATYSTSFVCRLFEEESKDADGEKLFTARQAILGHMQQGGNPMPFDRILATRFAAECIEFLEEQITQDSGYSACIGMVEGRVKFTDLQDVPRLLDQKYGRPKEQWWLALRPIARVMAQSAPSGTN